MKTTFVVSILILFLSVTNIDAFVQRFHFSLTESTRKQLHVRGGDTRLQLVINPATASILAGSIAGAVGVGKRFQNPTSRF